MIVIGIIAMFSLLIKIRNTKKMMSNPKEDKKENDDVVDVEYSVKNENPEVIEASVVEVKDTSNLIENKPIAIENNTKHKKGKK